MIFGARRIGDQAVEQFHLAACAGDVDRPDQLGKPFREQRLSWIKVVSHKRPASRIKKLDQEPRKQRLADPGPRRRDNVYRGWLHRYSKRILAFPNLTAV